MPDLTDWWTRRKDTSPASCQAMWDAWTQPHRAQIITALKIIDEPVESVYELGCGSGPNLRLLRAQYPAGLRLGGSEPNENLRAWASEHTGVRVDGMALPDVPESPWDVVISCYTLAYLEPPDLITTLGNLHGVCKRLVLMEPSAWTQPYEGPGLYSLNGSLPSWAHDWPGMLRNTGWTVQWRWPVIPHVDGLNNVVIAQGAGHGHDHPDMDR